MTFPTDPSSGNPFKLALQQRQAQVGLWLSMADPYLAEVSATAGVDFDVGERRGEALGARLGRVLGPGDGCGGVAEGAGERGRERCGDGFCG